MNKEKLRRAEQICDHTFSDQALLEAALTHPSALEHSDHKKSYERLEFLGDSVVGFIVARALFEQFPNMDEGKLTRLKVSLVSGKTLSALSKELGIGECIIFGSSESGTGSRGYKSALENVYESLVGALLLDASIQEAENFVLTTLGPKLKIERANIPESPKSFLQENIQRDFHETPQYTLLEQSGPAHKPHFVCQAVLNDKVLGTGSGSSKKEAESQAALDALLAMKYLEAEVKGE